MPTTIKLKNSVTTTNAPSSLVQGEVAINITDKKVWVGNAATTPIQLLGAGASGTFGALTCTSLTNSGLTSGRVTYASTGGLLADSANFTFNGTTVTMANDASISGLTVGKGANSVSSNTAFGSNVLRVNSVSGGANTGMGTSAFYNNTDGSYNSAFGYTALGANTTGNGNVGIGAQALNSNTTNSNNTAVGYQALYTADAVNNVAVGYQALYLNTTGAPNTAVGSQALQANTIGTNNTAIGFRALYLNTTGIENTAIGRAALLSNTTGSSNTAQGYQALYSNTTASSNTAVGYQAGYSNTTASENTFLAKGAGYTNTTGTFNLFAGYHSGYYNTTGSYNTYIGHAAGPVTTASATGSYNTAVGQQSLAATTTGQYNTAVGYLTGGAITTGQFNVIMGRESLKTGTVASYNTCIGNIAGRDTTGDSNTLIGAGAGYLISTGTKNTVLGAFNGSQGGLDIRTASNYIVLSDGDGNPRCYWSNNGVMFQSVAYTDNFIAQIINSTATRPYGLYVNFSAATPNNTTERFLQCSDNTNEKCTIFSSGTVTNRTGTYNAFSDIKLKQDIVDAGSQWDDIKAVRVRKFRLKDEVAANPDTKPLIGVIAQELEQTSAGLIDDCVDKEGEVTKSVKYSILYMKAIKALQEAMERIETLEAKVQQLENK